MNRCLWQNGATMDFNFFLEKVRCGLVNKISSDVKIQLTKVMKNNGCLLEGFIFSTSEQNISPTIYVNDFFEAYLEGKPLSVIVDEILSIYETNKLKESINMDFFLSYDKVRSKILFKLIDLEKNQKLLEKTPHIPYLNLAIVFYYLLQDGPFGNATILIQNSHIETWEKSREDLYEEALNNTPKTLPVQLKGMDDIIREMMADSKDCDNQTIQDQIMEEVKELPSNKKMYVLSNESKVHGASAILYPNVLTNFSKAIGKGFYILPSSIHEVILLPFDEALEPENLKLMVQEVNETQVREEEVLSNSVYLYSPSGQEILMC